MKISVVIPTFKPENYIFDCLDSIKNQTFCKCDFTIIIVLNGPKYPFYDILQGYAETSKLLNIQIIYTETKGVSNARNLALDIIFTKYVVFMDDDDIISSNYLAELYKKIDENKIAVSNVKTFKNDLCALGDDYISRCFMKLKYNQKYNLFKYRGFLSSVCGKIIPVSIIGKNRFNRNFNIGEDCLFVFSISNRIREITLCEDNVVYYRRLRDGSATRCTSSIKELLAHAITTIISYTGIYLSKPFQYNLLFYFSRIFATVLEVFTRLNIRKKSFIKIVHK